MNNFKFSNRSKNNLIGVHPDLVKVAHKALEITKVDFVVIEGVRTFERQKQMVREGKSKTLNSRHLRGHAIDVVPYPVSWEPKAFVPVIAAFKAAAAELNVPMEFGADWKGFPDHPHCELSRKHYP